MGAKIDSEAEPKVLGVLQEEAEHAASLREGASSTAAATPMFGKSPGTRI